eukprot:1707768-Lingulodinium_polyedra.AAC.1
MSCSSTDAWESSTQLRKRFLLPVRSLFVSGCIPLGPVADEELDWTPAGSTSGVGCSPTPE